jgi:hypothetical protein
MLPTWPISLLARPSIPARSTVGPICARRKMLWPGVAPRPMKLRGGLDSSAGEPVVAEARTRAAVHVAFIFVHSPGGDRGEPCGSSENHLRRRPLSRVFAVSTQFAVNAKSTGCFAPSSESTIARREATLRPRAASFFHSASRQRSTLRPPARQGGPPNQERIRPYEERNVGQCLAARGVPHRHR